MPFWKKMFNKRQGVYYPRAVVQGKPVETPGEGHIFMSSRIFL